MSANDPLMKHRKPHRRHPKPGSSLSREQHGRLPTYWPCGGPVYRRHDSYPGFRTELENRVGDAKGKGTSGHPTRPKVPMDRSGADGFVIAKKRVIPVERRGQATHVGVESTGNRRNSVT